MHPKNQVIKKEKLAKCYNAILMNPNQVCQSSAINFNRFASVIEKTSVLLPDKSSKLLYCVPF